MDVLSRTPENADVTEEDGAGDVAERAFSLRLVGPGHAVDVRDFVDLMTGTIACLRCLEEESGSTVAVVHRLVGLELGSAAVTIRSESKDDGNSTAREVVANFERGIGALKESKIDQTPFSAKTRQSFVKIQKPLRRGNQVIEFKGNAEYRLDHTTLVRTRKAKQREIKSIGSVAGRVEALNIHEEMVFYVYPVSGPTRIACRFTEDMFAQVQAAIDRYVAVHGKITYDETGTFPAKVKVDRIEAYEDERPRLKDLFGLVPNLTGGIESAAYVRAMRDAED